MNAALMLLVVLAAPRNACEVLTRADLAAVQGEAYADTKHSSRGITSQCFYQLPSFANSVSLDVTRNGRELWLENFDPEHPERKKHPPQPVKGIGDEAFWVGGHMAGSLYVRHGDAVIRVSVGGKGTEEEKIAKSKTLAKIALKRM